MIKIGILGDIGSGKSYVAQKFGYPVFNADYEVAKLYKLDKKIFNQLKKNLPKYIYSFPVKKTEISNSILANNKNLKKIVKIVHKEIRKKMNIFLNFLNSFWLKFFLFFNFFKISDCLDCMKTNISSFLLILFSNNSGISKITIFLFLCFFKNIFIFFLISL